MDEGRRDGPRQRRSELPEEPGEGPVRGPRPGPEDARGEPERRPMDPTRKLLKVFGVKVTDYEARTDALLAGQVAGRPIEMAVVREIVELTADLDRWLREIQGHVLERQERVLARLVEGTTDDRGPR